MVCVSVCDVGNQERWWNFKQEHICRGQFNSGLPHAIQKCHHNKQLIVSVTGSRKRHIRSAQFPQNALWFSHRMAQYKFLFALLDIVLTRWEIHTEHIALPFCRRFFRTSIVHEYISPQGPVNIKCRKAAIFTICSTKLQPMAFSALFPFVSLCPRFAVECTPQGFDIGSEHRTIEQLDPYDTIFVILNFTSFLWHFVNILRWKSLLWDVLAMVSGRKMFYFLSLLGIL
jgi:hypothetical protein